MKFHSLRLIGRNRNFGGVDAFLFSDSFTLSFKIDRFLLETPTHILWYKVRVVTDAGGDGTATEATVVSVTDAGGGGPATDTTALSPSVLSFTDTGGYTDLNS